jgi:hypothetical protein
MKIQTYAMLLSLLLCLSKIVLCNAQQESVTTDAQITAGLKIKKDIQQPQPYTQTSAWLSLKTNRELRDALFPSYAKEPYKTIIEKAVVQEEAYRLSHYVFYYTTVPAIKIIRDLYTELYHIQYKKRLTPGFPFLLLQTMDKKSFCELYTDTEVQSVINAKIATNISLFSNIESKKTAVNYFVHAPKNTQLEPWHLEFIATQLSMPASSITHYIQQLQELYNKYFTHAAPVNNNTLLQIFIPKEQTATNTYITMKGLSFSWDPGVIVRILLNEAINGAIISLAGEELFTNAFKRLVWVPDVLGQDTNITSKPYQQFKHAVDTDLVETAAFKTAPFLQAFMTTPYIIAHSNNAIEAKILFSTQQVVIEPESTILFFEYSTLQEKQNSEYYQQLHAIAEQIILSLPVHSVSTVSEILSTPETSIVPAIPTSKMLSVPEVLGVPSTRATTEELSAHSVSPETVDQRTPIRALATQAKEKNSDREKIQAEIESIRQKIKADMITIRESMRKSKTT